MPKEFEVRGLRFEVVVYARVMAHSSVLLKIEHAGTSSLKLRVR